MNQSKSNFWWVFASLTFAMMGLISCQSSVSSSSSQIEVKTDREDAQISIVTEGNKGSVNVHSESGIGRSQVDLVSGHWPERVILRFHLSGLEGMKFHYGDTTVSVSVNSSEHVLQSVTTSDESQRPISQESAHWMPVRIVTPDGIASTLPLAEGVIEVEAPRDFLDGDFAGFTLEWVDFYR